MPLPSFALFEWHHTVVAGSPLQQGKRSVHSWPRADLRIGVIFGRFDFNRLPFLAGPLRKVPRFIGLLRSLKVEFHKV